MLSEQQLEILSDAIRPLFQHLEQEVILDIARRVQKTMTYTRTAELMAMDMQKLGYSPNKIRAEVMKVLRADKAYMKAVEDNTVAYKKAVKELIDEIVKNAAEMGNEIIANAGNMSWIDDMSVWESAGRELTDNSFLHDLQKAIAEQTIEEMINLTRTTGFKTMSGFESIGNAYRMELDKAMIKLCTGTFSQEKVLNDVIHNLAQSGLRSIDYASGYTMQLDTAVKNALRTGCGQISAKMMDENLVRSGENLVYVSGHWGARNKGIGVENHELWQSKVYFIKPGKDYSEEAERIGQDRIMDIWYSTGYSPDGSHENNPLGLHGYNCRHSHRVWFEGASSLPQEQPEPAPVTINGKTYDYYQMTQKMRSMERNIRALKKELVARESLKLPRTEIKAKIQQKTREYEEFCRKCKVPERTTNLRVDGSAVDVTKTKAYKVYQNIVNNTKYDIINKETLSRAKNIRTFTDLEKVSSSKVISMSNLEEIVEYFKSVHGIDVEGFSGRELFSIKATLAGYDDMLSEFPDAKARIKKIEYNPKLSDMGNLNIDTKISQIGPSGLKDYGTGLHEAAHAYDLVMSKPGTHSYAEEVIELARKNLRLRRNSKEYINLVVRMTGLPTENRAYELFAYAIETAKGGIDNKYASEIYRIVRERQ